MLNQYKKQIALGSITIAMLALLGYFTPLSFTIAAIMPQSGFMAYGTFALYGVGSAALYMGVSFVYHTLFSEKAARDPIKTDEEIKAIVAKIKKELVKEVKVYLDELVKNTNDNLNQYLNTMNEPSPVQGEANQQVVNRLEKRLNVLDSFMNEFIAEKQDREREKQVTEQRRAEAQRQAEIQQRQREAEVQRQAEARRQAEVQRQAEAPEPRVDAPRQNNEERATPLNELKKRFQKWRELKNAKKKYSEIGEDTWEWKKIFKGKDRINKPIERNIPDSLWRKIYKVTRELDLATVAKEIKVNKNSILENNRKQATLMQQARQQQVLIEDASLEGEEIIELGRGVGARLSS